LLNLTHTTRQTPELCATSCGRVPLAKSFLAARILLSGIWRFRSSHGPLAPRRQELDAISRVLEGCGDETDGLADLRAQAIDS